MNNPYYKERIIAFVDILGFKEKIAKSNITRMEAESIHRALNRIYKVKKDNEGSGFMNLKSQGVEVTTFSDSAVISYPAEKDNLLFLILDLIHLQLDLTMDDVLIRGGLTIGDLYHDGNIVYGPAMNMAYKLESQVAIYPRIIVDKAAIEQYYAYVNGDEYDLNDIESLLRRDRDGLFYVDMLNQDQEMNDAGTEYYEWLSVLRNIIITGLSHKDIAVKVKYQWLQEYFNEVVTDGEAYFPVPDEALYDDKNEFRKAYASLEIK